MTLSKVVRKGSYQGVSQWGISTSSEITPSRATARKWAELENARIADAERMTEETKVKVGDVVSVRSGKGTINAFVFRTFTNGEFRAIPETHKMYRDVLGWHQAGNMAELKTHQVEIEYMSRVYSPSELCPSERERIHAENLARVTSNSYRRAERGIARKEKAIRRNVNN